MQAFDYSRIEGTDFRKHPERYQVGKGEQGVLMVEPYKSEILPHWRFKTPTIARTSAKKIYALFQAYKKEDDFVGMDMARKFLQMGYTRAALCESPVRKEVCERYTGTEGLTSSK